MIPVILRIGWLNLRRDVVALGLTFVLPIVFFSIFAMIFGGMASGGGTGPGAMRVIVVDLDGTPVSERFVEAIAEQDALRVERAPQATVDDPEPAPYTADAARLAVRRGRAPVAVILPEGFGASFGAFGTEGEPIELVHDPSNPLALYTVSGLLQASAMTAAPDVLMEKGIGQLETFGGALTPGQRTAVDGLLSALRGDTPWDEFTGADADDGATGESGGGESGGGESGGGAGPAFGGLVTVNAVSARADEEAGEEESNSIIAYYAAGIGVMFLLFSMAGAAGSLLEEQESGTLDRVLSTNVGMGTLLSGNWLFFTIVGFVQLVVMFLWGELVYGLDLFTGPHLVGFVALTAVTAAAAAAFGLILATLCRTRSQLSGISTVVILVMSALGGSMVPRFVMPEFMNTTALLTFNGWALDGYLKVFWYDEPGAGVGSMLVSIAPQAAVLAGLAIVFLAVARLLARRWETA